MCASGTLARARCDVHAHQVRVHTRPGICPAVLAAPQVLKTDKTDFDAEMERTGKLGGMDSAPPAFIGLSLFVVAYLAYLVIAS